MQSDPQPCCLAFDILTESYFKSSPDGRSYPDLVRKKLNTIRKCIKEGNYAAAFNCLTDINNYIFRDYSQDELQRTKLDIEKKLLLENFNQLVQELRKMEKELEELRNQKCVSLLQTQEEDQIKIAAFDALTKDDLDTALKISKKKDYKMLERAITDTQQYRKLLKEDHEYITNMKQFRKWNQKDIKPPNSDGQFVRQRLKYAYDHLGQISEKANVVIKEYFKERSFKKTCQTIWSTFNIDQLSMIFNKNWEFFNYAKTIHDIQDTLIERKIIGSELSDEARSGVLVEKVREIVEYLGQCKFLQLKKQGWQLEQLELTQQDLQKLAFNGQTISSHIDRNIQMREKISQKQRQTCIIQEEVTKLMAQISKHKQLQRQSEQSFNQLQKKEIAMLQSKKTAHFQQQNKMQTYRPMNKTFSSRKNPQYQHKREASSISLHESAISQSSRSVNSSLSNAFQKLLLSVFQFEDIKKKISPISVLTFSKLIYKQTGEKITTELVNVSKILNHKDFLIVMEVSDYKIIIFYKQMMRSVFADSEGFLGQDKKKQSQSDMLPQVELTSNGFVLRLVPKKVGEIIPAGSDVLFVPNRIASVRLEQEEITIGQEITISLKGGKLITSIGQETQGNTLYKRISQKNASLIKGGGTSRVDIKNIEIHQIQTDQRNL